MRFLLIIQVLLFSFMLSSVSFSSSIKFFNGYLLEEKESGSGGPPGKSYQLIDLNSNKIIDKFNTFRGKIKKIFYSSDNKEVVAVIINESDGGSDPKPLKAGCSRDRGGAEAPLSGDVDANSLRSTIFTKGMLKRFGFTKGCKGCTRSARSNASVEQRSRPTERTGGRCAP